MESPQEFRPDGTSSVFLAGGITGIQDWQARAVQLLAEGEPGELAVLNPRRADFPLSDPDAHAEQVAWEHRHLARADVLLFWFAAGPSDQPIALFELGAHTAHNRHLAVGADPDYSRRRDVVEQLRHCRPDLAVWPTLEQTVDAARGALMGVRQSPSARETGATH